MQNVPDLFHGQAFVVIESEDETLFFGELVDSCGEALSHFGLQAAEEWIVLRGARDVGELFVAGFLVALDVQATDFQAFQVAQELLVFDEFEAKFGSDLLLGRCAAEAVHERSNRFLDGATLAPKFAGTPVQGSERIENGAANAELRVTLELYLLGVVELGKGVDQADNAGGNEIVKLDVLRKSLVDSPCDVTDSRQVLEQYTVAFGISGTRRGCSG